MMQNQSLNEGQQLAATTFDQPICVLAGAGTGKTRVITHRMVHLIQDRGALPEQILAVTFTNKAAQEMRERVNQLLPGVGRRLFLGTFHGMAARFLRMFGEYVGVPRTFLIYDQSDAERLMTQLGKTELQIPSDRIPILGRQIESWQNAGKLPCDVPASPDLMQTKALSLYRAYLARLEEIGAVDFNLLLIKWLQLFRHETSRAQVLSMIRHVLVDEFQDTNSVQAQLIQEFSRDVDTIAVVGDDDQTIYGWRGASANHMQQFLQRVKNVKLIKLEENYRSTRTILNAANEVIARNASRIGKTLSAHWGDGEPIRLIKSSSDLIEAQVVVGRVEAEIQKGIPLSEMAVLMRTNAQSRPFEEALRRARLPYQIIGGVKFYERREIKDILATLRAAINPRSNIDMLRALYAIPRGVGESSMKKVADLAYTRQCSIWDILVQDKLLETAGVSKRSRRGAVEFAQSVGELGQKIQSCDADVAVGLAIEASGVVEYLVKQGTDEAKERIDNIEQLFAAAKQFVEDVSSSGVGRDIVSFLEAAALLASTETQPDSETHSSGYLTLMTLHAAKGLEFETVFMVGMEEYGFPHARALEEGAPANELEEERRLAYVGMTRARRRLFMTFAERRLIHGSLRSRIPSRFLRELPQELVEGDSPFFRQSSYDSPHFEKRRFDPPPPATCGIRVELDPGFAPSGAEEGAWDRGKRVWHSVFGNGTVTSQRGSGALARAVVRFDQHHQERVIICKHLRVIA